MSLLCRQSSDRTTRPTFEIIFHVCFLKVFGTLQRCLVPLFQRNYAFVASVTSAMPGRGKSGRLVPFILVVLPRVTALRNACGGRLRDYREQPGLNLWRQFWPGVFIHSYNQFAKTVLQTTYSIFVHSI